MLLYDVEMITGGVANFGTLKKETAVIPPVRVPWVCYLGILAAELNTAFVPRIFVLLKQQIIVEGHPVQQFPVPMMGFTYDSGPRILI